MLSLGEQPDEHMANSRIMANSRCPWRTAHESGEQPGLQSNPFAAMALCAHRLKTQTRSGDGRRAGFVVGVNRTVRSIFDGLCDIPRRVLALQPPAYSTPRVVHRRREIVSVFRASGRVPTASGPVQSSERSPIPYTYPERRFLRPSSPRT